MNRTISKRATLLLNLTRAALVVFLIAAAIYYFASGNKFSVEAVLSYTPSNIPAAIAFILALYAIKSIVFFLPLMVIQIAVGLYFPTWLAIIINIVGMAVELNIPYFIGRKLGFGSADKLFAKVPKIRGFVDGDASKWFISYILRAVNMLPMDLVSMYLGSANFPYFTYFTGSLVGALFGILAATFIGMSLTDPFSPLFIGSCVASCLIAISATVVYRIIVKKQNK